MKLSVKVTVKSDSQSDDTLSSCWLFSMQNWMVYSCDKQNFPPYCFVHLCPALSCGMLGQMHVGKRERTFKLPYSQ